MPLVDTLKSPFASLQRSKVHTTRYVWWLRVLVLIILIGSANACPTQPLKLQIDTTYADSSTFWLLPSIIAFQYISWLVLASSRSRLSRVVLLALEISAVLGLCPALGDMGAEGSLVETASSFLLLLKLLLLQDGSCTRPCSLPIVAYGRCRYCNSASCNGSCGQGGS